MTALTVEPMRTRLVSRYEANLPSSKYAAHAAIVDQSNACLQVMYHTYLAAHAHRRRRKTPIPDPSLLLLKLSISMGHASVQGARTRLHA